MRHAFVVTYDISDPSRWRQVYKTMRGYGEHIQLSVFLCELTAVKLVELRAILSGQIHHGEDQVLFIDIGPADGRAVGAVHAIGRRHEVEGTGPVIV